MPAANGKTTVRLVVGDKEMDVDPNSVHGASVINAVHRDVKKPETEGAEQEFRSGLSPATFDQIKSLFEPTKHNPNTEAGMMILSHMLPITNADNEHLFTDAELQLIVTLAEVDVLVAAPYLKDGTLPKSTDLTSEHYIASTALSVVKAIAKLPGIPESLVKQINDKLAAAHRSSVEQFINSTAVSFGVAPALDLVPSAPAR